MTNVNAIIEVVNSETKEVETIPVEWDANCFDDDFKTVNSEAIEMKILDVAAAYLDLGDLEWNKWTAELRSEEGVICMVCIGRSYSFKMFMKENADKKHFGQIEKWVDEAAMDFEDLAGMTKSELKAIPGIGKVLAKTIVACQEAYDIDHELAEEQACEEEELKIRQEEKEGMSEMETMFNDTVLVGQAMDALTEALRGCNNNKIIHEDYTVNAMNCLTLVLRAIGREQSFIEGKIRDGRIDFYLQPNGLYAIATSACNCGICQDGGICEFRGVRRNVSQKTFDLINQGIEANKRKEEKAYGGAILSTVKGEGDEQVRVFWTGTKWDENARDAFVFTTRKATMDIIMRMREEGIARKVHMYSVTFTAISLVSRKKTPFFSTIPSKYDPKNTSTYAVRFKPTFGLLGTES